MLAAVAAAILVLGAHGVAPGGKAPHVLFLLADDFGWHNSGHRGDVESAEVVTPNLRALTEQGLLLNRHYVYKICAPTRCSLQTGKLAVGDCPPHC
jgi:arylsulfatase A-like enzyme